MNIGRRLLPKEGLSAGTVAQSGMELPKDYRKMVGQVFSTTFKEGLDRVAKIEKDPSFHVEGMIYSDEVILCVSLLFPGKLAATSVYASCDFDPKASAPKAEDLLSTCVDAVGSIFAHYLEDGKPARLELLLSPMTAVTEDGEVALPLEWTEMLVDKRKVYLRVDRTNPLIEKMTEDWLDANDPLRQKNKKH